MRLRFVVYLFFISASAFASIEMPDTVHLDEITLYGDTKRYQPGSKFQKFTIEQIEATQDGGIDQLFTRFTPVYIKGNAGGLSTIKVRGTASSHTSINFGGINLNSLTLGHSNMTAIPAFLFDRVELQYGGSAALNGSGAIGGAVYLGQTNQWTNGITFETKFTKGAFGEYFSGAKFFIGNGKFEAVTRVYYLEKENNFPFKNKYTGNVEDRSPINDIQKGAALSNKGILQEFNYLFSPSSFFRSSIWLNKSWQQIQPNMQSNLSFVTPEEILDENIRFWSEYKNEEHVLKWSVGAGYVHDYQMYNNAGDQTIITNRVIAETTIKRGIGKNMEAKLGAKYQFIVPDVYSYSKVIIKNEEHFDVFASYYFKPMKQLKATINLRQMFVTNYKTPFTPAFGVEYIVSSSNKDVLSATANISRSYRIPTFNDRFWGSQGNPNLIPEDGLNIETGAKYDYCNGDNFFSAKLNAYYIDVDNWIEWRNFGIWQAQNVQRVVSKGIELLLLGEFEAGRAKQNASLSMNLNSSQSIENINGTGVVNHQLIYSPIIMGTASYQLKFSKNTFSIDGTYVGTRYANYLGSTLKPYFLTNIAISRKMKLWQQQVKCTLTVNNLFDVSYENEKYYAMPGINYRLALTLFLKYSNHN